MENLML
jgi:hypothetical protein